MSDQEQAGAREERAVALLRRAGVVEEPPPARVWEAIVATVHAETEGIPRRSRDARLGAAWPPGGRVRTLAARWPLVLAGAAAGALVTWAGFALGGPDGRGTVLAAGQLAPLTEAAPAGAAEVVEVDGSQRLRVSLDDVPEADDGYLEVWLLRPDVSGLVTLGVLEGDSGEFLLPPGLDLGEYPVVDISLERVDGDPGHGGHSLVRGEVG